jgi:hypothetical protein
MTLATDRGTTVMDEETVDRILDGLEARIAERNTLACLSEHERNIYLPYLALGKMSNGGFKYFFEDVEPSMTDVVHGFRTLGLGQVADACDRSLDAFPGRIVPSDIMVLHRMRPDFSRFDAERRIVLSVSFEQLKTRIGEYVSRLPTAFGIR